MLYSRQQVVRGHLQGGVEDRLSIGGCRRPEQTSGVATAHRPAASRPCCRLPWDQPPTGSRYAAPAEAKSRGAPAGTINASIIQDLIFQPHHDRDQRLRQPRWLSTLAAPSTEHAGLIWWI